MYKRKVYIFTILCYLMTKRGRHITCLEQPMKEALEKANISAVPEFPIRCKYGYIIDFAIPELKICEIVLKKSLESIFDKVITESGEMACILFLKYA